MALAQVMNPEIEVLVIQSTTYQRKKSQVENGEGKFTNKNKLYHCFSVKLFPFVPSLFFQFSHNHFFLFRFGGFFGKKKDEVPVDTGFDGSQALFGELATD